MLRLLGQRRGRRRSEQLQVSLKQRFNTGKKAFRRRICQKDYVTILLQTGNARPTGYTFGSDVMHQCGSRIARRWCRNFGGFSFGKERCRAEKSLAKNFICRLLTGRAGYELDE